MSTRSVKHNGVKATVREATVADGITLGKILRAEPEDIKADEDYHNHFVSIYVFVAPVTEIEGQESPITFQEFLEFDQVFATKLMAAVRDVNAHWFAAEESDEKKAEQPANQKSCTSA